MKKQLFIAHEGGDGAGKETQSKMTAEALRAQGRAVFWDSYPRYDSETGQIVYGYLHGEFGELHEVDADTAARFYADDRLAAAPELYAAIDKGMDISANRWVGSNLAHQATKIDSALARRAFYDRTLRLEYQANNLPQPDISVVLLVDPAVSRKQVESRGRDIDIHEADKSHAELAYQNYQEICEYYPDLFVPVECMENGSIMSREKIHRKIMDIVEQL